MLLCTRAPLQEPVSLGQVKSFLKVDDESDDSLIEDIIKAARQFVEDFTGQSLLEQHWQLKIFPKANLKFSMLTILRPTVCGVSLRLPKVPIIDIEKVWIQYNSQKSYTLSENMYRLEGDACNAQLVIPSIHLGEYPLNIHYKAGYGENPTTIPPLFIQAILMKCAELYENRGDQISIIQPSAIEQLLKPYKILHFGLERQQII